MPNVQGQVNAQRQQQQNFQIDYELIREPIKKAGHSAAELKNLELKRQAQEDAFFCNIVHDEKYKELGDLQNYLNERKHKDWAQNFDECQKKSDEIFAEFRKLYSKNYKKENWEEGSKKLAQLKADALALTKTMTKRDNAQKAIRDNANFKDFDAELKVMIQKASDSGSPTYKAVVAAAKDYMAAENILDQLHHIWRMQACMKEYAKLRYKTKYGTTEGERRMNQVTKLLAMTDKFLECQESLEIRKEAQEISQSLTHELENEEVALFEETHSRYSKITTKQFVKSRWNQPLLPYKRDKNGKVTEETKENYEISMKFLKAFQTKNTRRQMAAIARVFLKQNLLDYSKEDLKIENVFKFDTALYGKYIQKTNKPVLLDFLADVEKRMKSDKPLDKPLDKTLLQYMSNRLSDPAYGAMTAAFDVHMKNIGIDAAGIKKYKGDVPGKAKEDFFINNANINYDALYQPLDLDLENKLRKFIEEVDKEEQEEKQNPASTEYLKELCRYQEKRKKLYEDKAQTLINERYSDHINGENKYWKKKSHLGSLLLPYTVNKDGKVASKSEQFFKYNEKIMPLLHSEDPEDRIAALASVFLRLRKFDFAKELPTGSTIAKYDKEMLETPGFVSQYQAFGDFLAEEAKRSPDHPMIKYMKKVYENPLTGYSLSLVNTNRYAHGYDNKGAFMDNAELETQSQKIFADIVELTTEEMKKQKAENNNQLVYTDETEEAKLKQLCESKGLKIFNK